MASATTYISAGVAFVTITILFLIAIAQNSVDEKNLMSTPTIPIQKGVLTSFASTRIKASAEDVFAAMINFKGYSTWSAYSGYKWDSVAADGVPLNGNTGSFKLSLDGFPAKTLPVKLTMLDRESKRIAEITTHYPHWLLASERVQEVVPVEGEPGLCEYRTWQTLTGVAAYYLLLTARDELSEIQASCAQDLKSFIENGQ